MSYKVSVIIEKDNNGYFAYSPELEGCHSQGESFEEVVNNIKEAVELYIETMTEDEIKEVISKEIMNTSIEVKVA
ncbi:MAG: type II toxin-antitoxin system HicB family antitoxin [Ignavibacteria bacterium]|jgi:predicted RNase H-like HicB family nuclease